MTTQKTNLKNPFNPIISQQLFILFLSPNPTVVSLCRIYTIMHTRGIKSEILFYKAAETASNKSICVWRDMFHCFLGYPSNRMQQLRFARKTPQMTFSKPAGKMDTNLAFILKVICLKIQDSFFFCKSGILHSKKSLLTGLEIRLSSLFVAKLSRASLFLCCVVL